MKVYLLTHSREVEPGVSSSFLLGFYSSAETVESAIARYVCVSGFCDYPDDFYVDEYGYPGEILPGQNLYFLQHEYSLGEYDYVTRVDVFANQEDALEAKEKLKTTPEFRTYPGGMYPPDGFCIDAYALDEDNWAEGFISDDDPDLLRIVQEFIDAGLIPPN